MKVSEDNWQQLLKLLEHYLELSETERSALLKHTDEESLARGAGLRQLIRDFDAGTLFSAQDILAPLRAKRPRILHAGRRIGRYRLTRALGRGAMSAVWLAERRDAPGARPVAIKFFFSSSRTLEPQARLAALHHPGLARLLDGGIGDDHQPYLVWEHIEGLPLLKQAAAQRLGVARRVALMVEVLGALGHAHAQRVLHGCMKPSNVWLDAQGQVRLLDTGTSSYPPGRSDYHSPEQVLGEAPGAASDIYSAGVLLFELLSGRRPFRMRHGAARADAVLSARPPPLAQASLATQAADCGCTPRALRRQLDADLDAIVQRALEQDPAARYASADGFAQDLTRWLRHDCVEARPLTQRYRLRQFVRRSPVAVSFAGAVLLALGGALGFQVVQLQAARLEAARALGLNGFLGGLFDPDRRALSAAELLHGGLERVPEAFPGDPDAQIAAYGSLERLDAQVGDVEGASRAAAARRALIEAHPGGAALRLFDARLEEAAALLAALEPAAAAAQLEAARAALDAQPASDATRRAAWLLAQARLSAVGAVSESRRLADEAVAQLSQRDPADQGPEALRVSAGARSLLGDVSGAHEALTRALGVVQLRHPGDARARADLICDLAGVQARLFEVEDADAHYGTCLASAPAESRTRRALEFAHFEQATGRPDAARALLTATAPSDPWQWHARIQLALDAGAYQAAGALLETALPLLLKVAPHSLPASQVELQQAVLLTARGEFGAAAALEQGALNDARRSLGVGQESGALDAPLLTAARLDLARGEPALALERLSEVEDPPQAATPGPALWQAQLLKARARAASGQHEAALSAVAALLESLRRAPRHAYLTPLEAEVSVTLAQLELDADRPLEAQLHAERALSLRQAMEDPASLGLAEAQLALARSLIVQRQWPLAQQALAAAGALIAAAPGGAGPQYTGPLERLTEELNRALHPVKPKHRGS